MEVALLVKIGLLWHEATIKVLPYLSRAVIIPQIFQLLRLLMLESLG
jgi:hypothetical protein